MSEQITLGTEVLDIRTAIPTASEHQLGIDEDLASGVQPGTFARNGDVVGGVLTESQSVGEVPNSIEADVADDLGTAGRHNHEERAGSFDLVGALLCGELVGLQPGFPCQKGTYADALRSGHTVP